MYNQGNMRLHVDLFIKYVGNNGQFYIDITNNWPMDWSISWYDIIYHIFILTTTMASHSLYSLLF